MLTPNKSCNITPKNSRMRKKSYKTKVERDIQMSEDVKVSGIQGGKAIGNNLALFSFIIGIPLLILGLVGIISMMAGYFPTNSAIIILVLIVTALGSLLTIGGYFLHKG